jgi:asparagine synthase (glutamine-hydrolysing)
MCGICGTTDTRDGRALRVMNDRMVHRGPDDDGIFLEAGGGVGLGARRLSVIDVAGGHQPLANEDETVWAVLNGEIYNFQALREGLLSAGHTLATRCDTEVLVHLYEDRGDELVHDLEGMFAFAVWDSARRRLLLARDRFGEKPLFYAEVGGELVFASELTALLAGAGLSRELDTAAVDAYFVYGYVPGGGSIVEGARQLEPGHRLLWDVGTGRSELQPYWRPSVHQSATKVDPDRLVERAGELLERSVASRLIADVPLGVFLSGGLDSTLIAALAARHVSGGLKTFTVDYDVGNVGERAAAQAAAAAVGAEHHELIFTTSDVRDRVPGMLAGLDQPIADPAFAPLRALSEFARGEVTVAVGGEGADELFGGYPRYRWLARMARMPGVVPTRIPALAAGRLGRLPRMQRVGRLSDALAPGTTFDRHLGWVTSNRAGIREELYGPRLRAALTRVVAPDEALGLDLAGRDVLGSLMRLDQTHWLPGDVLAKADRASMGASLELRTPYLSRELAEFAATVPAAVHVREGGKFLLRRILQRVLPSFVAPRAKLAFRTPLGEWLRGPLRPVLAGQLEQSSLYRDGWFEKQAVANLVAGHAEGRDDLGATLWPLFVLGCWLGDAA